MHRYLTSTPFSGDLGGMGGSLDDLKFYSNAVVLTSPVTQSLRDALNAIFNSAMKAMPWVGGGVQGEAALIMNEGKLPILARDLDLADTDTKKAQWTEFWNAYSKTISPALKSEQQVLAAQGRALAANTAFWDKVYRINLAVATVGMSELAQVVKDKWAELQDRVQEWHDTREWIKRIASSPECPPEKSQQLLAKLAEMDSSVSGKITDLTSKVPGLAPSLKAEQGLGIIPVLSALASVPTAVSIAAIVGVIALIVYAISTMRGVVKDLGLDALGDALRQTTKLLGPFVGVAVLSLVGFILYKKFSKK
jgi:hypothetical protein